VSRSRAAENPLTVPSGRACLAAQHGKRAYHPRELAQTSGPRIAVAAQAYDRRSTHGRPPPARRPHRPSNPLVARLNLLPLTIVRKSKYPSKA